MTSATIRGSHYAAGHSGCSQNADDDRATARYIATVLGLNRAEALPTQAGTSHRRKRDLRNRWRDRSHSHHRRYAENSHSGETERDLADPHNNLHLNRVPLSLATGGTRDQDTNCTFVPVNTRFYDSECLQSTVSSQTCGASKRSARWVHFECGALNRDLPSAQTMLTALSSLANDLFKLGQCRAVVCEALRSLC